MHIQSVYQDITGLGRSILVVALVLSFAPWAAARVALSLDGGLNIANQSDPGNLIQGAVWTPRVGVAAGLSLSLQLSDAISFEPGVRFVQKGLKSHWYYYQTGDVNSTITNNYLDFPLYMSFKVAHFASEISLVAGPACSYLLTAHGEATFQYMGSVSLDRKANYNSYDATFDGGLRLTSPINEGLRLQLTALDSMGMLKVSTQGSDEMTRDIRVLLGVVFSP